DRSLFSFRHLAAAGIDSDEHNLRLVNAINNDGRIYLTQTRVGGQVAIRFQVGQFDTTAADVDTAFEVVTEIARGLG
ncbi:MAG: aspartate aminotransferase family protein, partial [Mesorhizobium sp.]